MKIPVMEFLHISLIHKAWVYLMNVKTATGRVFKNLANFIGKHLCWSLILMKLQQIMPAALQKLDFNTHVFLWHL